MGEEQIAALVYHRGVLKILTSSLTLKRYSVKIISVQFGSLCFTVTNSADCGKGMVINVKEFNAEKFCKDLIALRGKESQAEFARKLNIKRPTLSLLENGKQVPTLDILGSICNLSGKNTDEYFVESMVDSLVYLMGSLNESDKIKIEEMAERIRIKEKYELLAGRGSYVAN